MTKKSKRSKVAMKPVKETKAATKSQPFDAPSATPAINPTATRVIRSSSARANISEGTRLYALAGRPTKADFAKVYGPRRARMGGRQLRFPMASPR
jgi:hypothetical protein